MVTFLFTLMSPMMSKADQLAAKGDTKGIVRLNYLAMALLGLLFAIVCTLGMLGGSAMGTTLSNLAAKYGEIKACSGNTSIFLYPGVQFHCIDGLITNFHLPESTLIMLVSALYGYEKTMAAYKVAVEEKYRFFSFGDAMLIL